jgi:hypothetical protein
MNCTEKERMLKSAFRDITDKIAELWKAEKDKAPKLIIHDDPDKAQADNVMYYIDFHASMSSEFDEFEALDLKHILYWVAMKYFNSVNPALLKRYQECSSVHNLMSGLDSELEFLARRARERLADYDEKQREEMSRVAVGLEIFRKMIAYYTSFAVNESLGYGIDLTVSEDFAIANIRDSCPTGTEMDQEQDEEKKEIQFGELVSSMNKKNKYLPRLMAQRIYEAHRAELLPTLVKLDPDQAVNFVNYAASSTDLDSVEKVLGFFKKHTKK